MAIRIAIFIAVLAGAYLIGVAVSWILAIIFRISGAGSKLLRMFIVRWSRLLDDGYRIVCWPWVKTADANEVRWDIMQHAHENLKIEPTKESEIDKK